MHILKSQINILLILLFTATLSNAATINGYVIDATSAEPLPVASVVLKGTDIGASTNLDGYFIIDYIDPGVYTLVISYIGYHSSEKEIIVYDWISDPLYLEIEPASVALEDVEVIVKKNETNIDRRSPVVSAVPIEAKIVRTMSSLAGEMDVLRALQTIPGVKASSDINSSLHVRGGSPDQTLILMDHNVVYNPSHLFGVFSTFNADAVKHIDLMKGGFPAKYGGRSGSVLGVITNEGNRRKTEGLFSIGLVSARGSIEGPLPGVNGSYAFSIRRTYMDPVLEVMRKSQDIDLPDYYFYDTNGKINLDLTDRTTLTLAGYWGNDRMDMEFGPDDSRLFMFMSWGNRTLVGRLRHALGRNMFISFNGAVSRYRSKWSISNDDVLIDKARDRLHDYSFKTDFEWHPKNHEVSSGIWISQYDILFKEENEDLVMVDVSGKSNNYAFYIQDQWRMSDFIELQPGIIAYYHDTGNHKALDPRLTVVYHWDPQLRFKVAVGRYHQFINLMTFGEIFTNFDLWIPIDESMKPAYSDQAVVGFEWDHEDELEFTLEAYYTDMNDLAFFDPMVKEGNSASDAFVQGEGYAYGSEWMLRKNKGRYTGWIGYSLSWTKRRFPESLINEGNSFYPKWDRRHDFIIVGDYKLNRKWDLSATWRYNTGQGYTEGVGIFTRRYAELSTEDFGDYGRDILYGAKNNYRFPADHRLDFTASYNHLFFGKPAKLNISIYNAYSRRSYWQHSIDEGESPQVEVTDIKLLPILPLISYEVRF